MIKQKFYNTFYNEKGDTVTVNKILIDVFDGYKGTRDYPQKIFGHNAIQLLTNKNLAIGDRVIYKNYEVTVVNRFYYPESDEFYYICNEVYTGRSEE